MTEMREVRKMAEGDWMRVVGEAMGGDIPPRGTQEYEDWVEVMALTMWQAVKGPGAYVPRRQDEYKCLACRDSGWQITRRPNKQPSYGPCDCLNVAANDSPGAAMGFPHLSGLRSGEVPPELWDKVRALEPGQGIHLHGPAERTLRAGYLIADWLRRERQVIPKYCSARAVPEVGADSWTGRAFSGKIIVLDGVADGLERHKVIRCAEVLERARGTGMTVSRDGRAILDRRSVIVLGDAIEGGYPPEAWGRLRRAMEQAIGLTWRLK
jgi:hypothetical protein